MKIQKRQFVLNYVESNALIRRQGQIFNISLLLMKFDTIYVYKNAWFHDSDNGLPKSKSNIVAIICIINKVVDKKISKDPHQRIQYVKMGKGHLPYY